MPFRMQISENGQVTFQLLLLVMDHMVYWVKELLVKYLKDSRFPLKEWEEESYQAFVLL